jgi:hypothetical protein
MFNSENYFTALILVSHQLNFLFFTGFNFQIKKLNYQLTLIKYTQQKNEKNWQANDSIIRVVDACSIST